MLPETETSNVLPTSKYIPPNKSSDWNTTLKKMMSGVKTKKKPTNLDRDLSYGSGAASGGKAKKEKSKTQVSSQPIPQSAPAPPPSPPLLYTLHGPRPLATPPSFPLPAHPFPHPVPPLNPYQVPQHTYTQPTYPYYPYYYLGPRP
ncbi:hypothetical protein DFH07DRAFT_773515 [Mycena maculata]|uniref:Uncharacterized protein n=1 Tax=Mycena maculata TaxID=230809 RepID=A0AAD7J1B7_9AGAR|nr:hypothetical protein DFH07DRAFT_773515 [Mycena maculata]